MLSLSPKTGSTQSNDVPFVLPGLSGKRSGVRPLKAIGGKLLQQRTTGTIIRYLKLRYLQTQTDTSKSFIANSNGLAVINHYKEAIEDRLWDGFQQQPAALLA
ncbi:hypothetical protein llap_17925 [Limosa lapponica baueri]|uniref:Uncharacterized protein n=1 Tax=Limosa lapponica baueri TaxID=1758121 RepID=A0A2I0TDA0_LIMLA|nr:hypothetical protein llap_17925 [Limosa lapponica baueri]